MSTHTVELNTTDRAEYLASFAGVTYEGSTATLTDEALETLADLDSHTDGHYSGSHVYIGGVGFRVERVRRDYDDESAPCPGGDCDCQH